jgi:hypothetical protein
MRPPRDLAVSTGSDLSFQLHDASGLAAVQPEVRFAVGSRLETVATSTPSSSITLVRSSRHVAHGHWLLQSMRTLASHCSIPKLVI